jgi:signal transduction histidine kinase
MAKVFQTAIHRLIPRSPRQLPLRWVLVLPFVTQLAVAVGLTGYVSLQNGQKAVNDLVSQRNQEVSDRVLQHLDTFTQTSRRVAQISLKEMEAGQIAPTDSRSVQSFLWRQATTYQIGFLLYGNQQGQLLAAGNHFNDGTTSVIELNPQKYRTQHLYIYRADAHGNPLQQGDQINDYQFQTEDWFAKTLKVGQPNWSSIYNWQAPPYPLAVAASVPVKDGQGRVVGSIAAESRLSELSDFLRALPFSQAGRVFILERSGLLVANSDRSDPFTLNNNLPQRLKGQDSADPLIRATAQYLEAQFSSLQSLTSQHQATFVHQGERQFLQVVPWRDDWGLDWLVVVVVPESTFMAQIQANTRTTVLLCGAALAIAVLLGLYTSRWIAQPILQLSAASRAIAQGNFQSQPAHSSVREINQLGQSFQQMATQLESSFVALEQANSHLEARIASRTADLETALQELHQTQAQMIQTEKMSALGQMVAGIAHEINNPVGFILGNLEPAATYAKDLLWLLELYEQAYPEPTTKIDDAIALIDLEFVQEDLPNLLQSMQVGAERISEIVLSLRNFSRLDESEAKTVDLHEGIESTLMILQHRLKATSDRPAIQVLRQFGDLPKIHCRPGQLNQVFLNLLSNAIDALEDKTGDRSYADITANPNRITITTSSNLDQNQIYIVIADNGIGMEESVRQQIFNPFYTTKPVGKGTGLGLSISHQIITETHQGSLTCHSTLGEGSEFCIQLPAGIHAG